MLNLHIKDHPLAHIISLAGELNTQTCPALSRALDERFQIQKDLTVLDLSEVVELTSTAQKIIFDSHRRSLSEKSGKKIIFCHLSKDIERLVKITGLSKFIPVYPSTELALQTIKSSSH
jgi:anti-anti-sigma factor